MGETTIDRDTFLREWVADLRNPRSKQCRNRLVSKTGDAFCCLGIGSCTLARLCGGDIPVELQGTHPVSAGDRVYFYTRLPYCRDDTMLIDSNGVPRSCVSMNDFEELTFPQIADAIERTWPEAFKPSPPPNPVPARETGADAKGTP